MGFFSWKTADTNESIVNIHADEKTQVAYLIQPNNEKPVIEYAYCGIGVFGSVDTFEWLAERNLPKKMLKNFEGDYRDLGVSLFYGEYLKSVDGKVFCYDDCDLMVLKHLLKTDDVIPFKDHDSIIKVMDHLSTISEHIQLNRLVEIDFPIKYPLKFSFNENAVYKELGASKSCPNQGFGGDDE